MHSVLLKYTLNTFPHYSRTSCSFINWLLECHVQNTLHEKKIIPKWLIDRRRKKVGEMYSFERHDQPQYNWNFLPYMNVQHFFRCVELVLIESRLKNSVYTLKNVDAREKFAPKNVAEVMRKVDLRPIVTNETVEKICKFTFRVIQLTQ